MNLLKRTAYVLLSGGAGISLLFIILAGLAKANSFSTELLWQIKPTAAVQSFFPYDTSIAIDSSDRVHLIYCSQYHLYYAALSGTTWLTQPIELGDAVWAYDLTVDKMGKPHVAYIALDSPMVSTGSLRYAILSGTTWITQTIEDTAYIFGGELSMAMQENGRPYILYRYTAQDFQDLRYATLTNTGWTTQSINLGVMPEYQVLLEVDPTGDLHITYMVYNHVNNEGTINYGVRHNGTWDTQIVEDRPNASLDFGRPLGLKLDSTQKPHLLYFDPPYLKYAVLSGTTWLSATISGSRNLDLTYLGAMTLDSQDQPHIGFAGQYGQPQMYATLINEQWQTYTVDTAGAANSIAVDSVGDAYISYLNSKRLLLARSRPVVAKLFLPIIQNRHILPPL